MAGEEVEAQSLKVEQHVNSARMRHAERKWLWQTVTAVGATGANDNERR
jgi:hypothetical protein